jgi:DNA polymerase kappa
MTSEAQPTIPDEELPIENHEQNGKAIAQHTSLKYSLLGPSLTKAGQDSVDQSKASSCSFYRRRRLGG